MAGAWSLGAAGLHAVQGGAIGVELPEPEGRQACARHRADQGAVGTVSALRLSSHPHLSRARRLQHEPWPSIPAVAGRRPAVAAQAPEEACRCCSTAAASAVRRETRYGSLCSTAVPMIGSSSVTDEFTKERLAIDVDGRIRSPRVIEVLARLVSERGAPAFLRGNIKYR